MEWGLRFFLVSFLTSIIFTSALCFNYWKDFESDLSYHAIVKRPVDITEGDKIWGYCAGVILNTRYVLTLFKCARSGNILVLDKDIRIEIEQPKGRLDEGRYGEHGRDYIVEEVWFLHSLALLRSKAPFKLGNKCGVNLPKKGQLNLWKISFNMPNNVEIVSHKWCLDANYWHKIYITKGIRNCTDDEIYDTPINLVQSCLQHRTNYKCILPEGTPLIHNNILLGIKNYKGSAPPPPPHNNIKYDLFMNIIEEVPYIEKHMSDYEQCAQTIGQSTKNEF